ncbi:hypothetical protein AVEN_166065-1 [Araneus ventricosus]|uniref:Uncharacterized protein n=1 Tax=Araneus ventricosus TaxID=182803 RepID=A0A4Y2PWZ3_ARAVE|nr:hypothetical protein AVEN_166065-1 [Araneus ventricosus]
MNSDSRNFSIHQESPSLPSTFHSNQENEFVQFNQGYHKNFRYTQKSSEMNNESLYRQNISQPGSFQQIQNNCENNFEVTSTESDVLQPKAKNLSSVSEELGNSRNRLHKNRNFIDCEVSNRNLRNTQLQGIAITQDAISGEKQRAYNSGNIHEWQTSYLDNPEALEIQPSL